jgi:hypothetical protein
MYMKILPILTLPLAVLGIALPDALPAEPPVALKTLSGNVTTLGPDTYENLKITVAKYKAEHSESLAKRATCFGV